MERVLKDQTRGRSWLQVATLVATASVGISVASAATIGLGRPDAPPSVPSPPPRPSTPVQPAPTPRANPVVPQRAPTPTFVPRATPQVCTRTIPRARPSVVTPPRVTARPRTPIRPAPTTTRNPARPVAIPVPRARLNPVLPSGRVAGGPSIGTDTGTSGGGRSLPANLALVLLMLATLGAGALALIPAIPGAQMVLRPRQAAQVARRRPELIALAISGCLILLILVSL